MSNMPVDYKAESDRWEKGTEHHPMSIELMEWMMDIDFNAYDDHLCLKTGGDGDNGEHLMFLMDGFFERGKHLRRQPVHHLEAEITKLKEELAKMKLDKSWDDENRSGGGMGG